MTETDRTCMLVISQLFPELTKTERFSLIMYSIMGKTTKDIARENGIEITSVETHFRRAKKKLRCQSLHELVGFVHLRLAAHNYLKQYRDTDNAA